MGYCMEQIEAVFFIPQEKHEAALEALKNLVRSGEGMSGGSFGPEGQTAKWFSWVSNDAVLAAKTLSEAIEAFRWENFTDKEGNIFEIYFNGEKLGDDETFFRALAPFVRDGSYVALRGEDGYMWRWLFSDGKLVEQFAKITWED